MRFLENGVLLELLYRATLDAIRAFVVEGVRDETKISAPDC